MLLIIFSESQRYSSLLSSVEDRKKRVREKCVRILKFIKSLLTFVGIDFVLNSFVVDGPNSDLVSKVLARIWKKKKIKLKSVTPSPILFYWLMDWIMLQNRKSKIFENWYIVPTAKTCIFHRSGSISVFESEINL